jgi:hypothetical protein
LSSRFGQRFHLAPSGIEDVDNVTLIYRDVQDKTLPFTIVYHFSGDIPDVAHSACNPVDADNDLLTRGREGDFIH